MSSCAVVVAVVVVAVVVVVVVGVVVVASDKNELAHAQKTRNVALQLEIFRVLIP